MKLVDVKGIVNKKNGQINLSVPKKKIILPKDVDINKIKWVLGWKK